MIKNDNFVLEQKLANMDFYSELADKDKIFGSLINKLDIKENAKPTNRTFRSVIITATLFAIMVTSGLTVFADNIEGLLKQLGFTGGVANQVEQLGEEYEDDVIAISSVIGSDITYSDDVEWQRYNFDSLDEAKAAMCFQLIEPVGLPDNWKLKSIKGSSYDGKIETTWIELIYDDPNTNPAGKTYYSLDEMPRHTEFYVYQQYIGEGATLSIDTTEQIQNVTVNGVEIVLIDSSPDDWSKGGSLIWVQNGIQISICSSRCTYDEHIAFAEMFIK